MLRCLSIDLSYKARHPVCEEESLDDGGLRRLPSVVTHITYQMYHPACPG